MQKILSKSLLIPNTWTYVLQEETNLFLISKNVLIAMVPILIKKDVFEPSFDDLKFEVKNHNYFSINLNSNFGFCCF